MKIEILYTLYNLEGCFMYSANTTSLAKAREIFSRGYAGKYKIIYVKDNDQYCVKISLN